MGRGGVEALAAQLAAPALTRHERDAPVALFGQMARGHEAAVIVGKADQHVDGVSWIGPGFHDGYAQLAQRLPVFFKLDDAGEQHRGGAQGPQRRNHAGFLGVGI
ncbi:hypothetical protein D3C71_1813600 [compost metagenome]